MTESRRKELIALGFPDDGYDYLHHLKQLGPKTRRPSSRRKVSAQQRGSRHGVPMHVAVQEYEPMPCGRALMLLTPHAHLGGIEGVRCCCQRLGQG